MSSESPLVEDIDGYLLVLWKMKPTEDVEVLNVPVRLSKVGGAHVKNSDDLITMIEDAVYRQEGKDADTN